ncbi:MAG: flippase-like domain-containing protein [Spartobacteria bacterium]|nr:flippase-like domain-containing protein [Spartobacteria bacterium]
MAGRFRWTPLLRLGLGLALIAWLVRAIGLDAVRQAWIPVRAHPGWIAAALALTFAALCAGVVRWHGLMHRMGLPTPFSRTFRGYFIGQFFNAFLFGACGGDLARAVFAAHDHAARRAEAVTSVFLDRAIGLAVTLLFGCTLLVPRLRFFAGHAEARPALFLMGVFLLATLALLALFFGRGGLERLPGVRRLAAHGRVGPLLRRGVEALDYFRHHRRHLLVPTLLALANLLLLAAATAALARALEMPLAVADLLVVFPILTVLAAVPITPGSLGVRETLYVQLLHPFGIRPGPALMLSLLGYLAATAWSLFGGLLFLRSNRGGPGK